MRPVARGAWRAPGRVRHAVARALSCHSHPLPSFPVFPPNCPSSATCHVLHQGLATCTWQSSLCLGMFGGCGLRARVPLSTPRLAPTAARRARAAATPRNVSSFDSAAFDAERLAKDAVARDDAAALMAAQPGAWKWAIRKTIWDTLEATNEADFPRPVHHRIPNFKLAAEAAERLAALPEFVSASCIKINPDTPQRAVRFAALQAGKTLLTPQPRLRTGFFNRLSARDCPPGVEALREASTSAGMSNAHATALATDGCRRCGQVRQAARG